MSATADLIAAFAVTSLQPAASLLGLPPELRLRIYEYCFDSPSVRRIPLLMHVVCDRPRPQLGYGAGCSAVSLLLVCQIVNFEASPFLYKAVTVDIEFIHPSMEFIQTLQFSFVQLRHAHRIRKARITFHTDDRVGTVGSSEYLDSITATLVSLQYGALFEQIHIIVRTCCITRSGGAVVEAAFEAFSKIKCPGRVTIEWDSARLGSGTFVMRTQAEQFRAKFATLLETLKA
ncbi:hypothetical protein LTR95_009179 [Oleoguttula sp. CCFEE 5521]